MTIEGTKQQSYEYWVNIKQENIRKINFNGILIYRLTKIIGWTSSNNLKIYNKLGFQEFIHYIFGKTFDQEYLFNKNKVRDKGIKKINNDKKNEERAIMASNIKGYFKTIENNNILSYKYWYTYNQKDIRKLKFEGNGIYKLVSLSGWDNPNNSRLTSTYGFQEWINWIFNKEGITLNLIKSFFYNYKGLNKDKSYNYLISLNSLDIQTIKYDGIGISRIITISGFDKDNNFKANTIMGFHKWLSWLFSEKLNIIDLSSIKMYLYNYNGLTRDESYKYLISLNALDIRKLKYHGFGVRKLLLLSGWDINNKINIFTLKGFHEWINWLFGKESNTLNLTKEYFYNYNGLNKNDSYLFLLSLKKEDIKKIKYNGKGIRKLISYSGWNNSNNLSIVSIKWFQEWLKWLF